MPRFVIVIVVILLVTALAGGGFWWWQQRDVQEATVNTQQNRPVALQPAGEADRREQASPDADNDNDGLSNIDELQWNTDPDNPDTDGDGFLDGEEVTARHDPTIPAPNDRLDEAVPAQRRTGSRSLTSFGTIAPLTASRFLVDNFSAAISEDNLTEEYEKQYVASERTPATRDNFINAQEISVGLPRKDVENLISTSPESLEQYLALADNPNALANTTLYGEAQQQLAYSDSTDGFDQMVTIWQAYQEGLQEAKVPDVAEQVHQLLLGYTDYLVATFENIRGDAWTEDPVKSLVALRQVEAADRTYYPLIRTEFLRLSRLRNQLSGGG